MFRALIFTGITLVFAIGCSSDSTRTETKKTGFTKVIMNDQSQLFDPLPSWNEGKSRSAILEFVASVTNQEGSSFVKQEDRIAVFDNDGTLWVEEPMYAQFFFAIDRIKTMASQHPEWNKKQPFKAILEDDMEALDSITKNEIIELVMTTHSGMTTTEFEAIVKEWISTAVHPKLNKPYTQCVYQPMLELIEYLKANKFKVFIASGGGIEFMRVWASEVYGIPPGQIIGSSIKTKFEVKDGKPVLVRLPELEFVDDKAGKPSAINAHIGQRPIAAIGNSDGDIQMLEWTTIGRKPSLGLIVHHDDEEREFAYDRDSLVGKLDQGIDEAAGKGWILVSIKNDWKTVFKNELK